MFMSQRFKYALWCKRNITSLRNRNIHPFVSCPSVIDFDEICCETDHSIIRPVFVSCGQNGEPVGCIKDGEISWLSERLSASLKGIASWNPFLFNFVLNENFYIPQANHTCFE